MKFFKRGNKNENKNENKDKDADMEKIIAARKEAIRATSPVKIQMATSHVQLLGMYSKISGSDIANFCHYLIKTRCEKYNKSNSHFPAECILDTKQMPDDLKHVYKSFTLRIPKATYVMLEEDCKRYKPFLLTPDMLAQTYLFEGLLVCSSAADSDDDADLAEK